MFYPGFVSVLDKNKKASLKLFFFFLLWWFLFPGQPRRWAGGDSSGNGDLSETAFDLGQTAVKEGKSAEQAH